MKNCKVLYLFVVVVFMLISTMTACNQSGDNTQKLKAIEPAEMQKILPLPDAQKLDMKALAPAAQKTTPAAPTDVIAQVDDAKLTRGQLDTELKKSLTAMSGKIPPDQLAQATTKVRRQIVDDFIVRKLLGVEVNRQKIEATDKEITEALSDLKKSLPSGVTMEEMMKKNGITPEKLREEVSLGIRINKLVAMQPASKTKPTDQDVNAFYKNNQDKFKMPETVHARHILIAKTKGEDEPAKAKSKSKAEDLRKQLLAGADFAELAKTNSDCPSKANGGDLGTFAKGQMVKPFETAAFGQKKNEIGPVVETDFGYHIIQVLDHSQPKTQPFDQQAKAKINAYLQQQKRYEAFNELMTRLKAKAKIVVAEKID